MVVEPLHVVDGKQFITRSVPLRSFLIGSKLHFKQGHCLQCPGIIFALLCAPKDVLRNVLHPRRTHRMRQRGYRSRQRFIHRRNQIGRERGIRKVFHPLRPVRGSWGAYVIQPAGRPHVPDLRRIAEQMTRGDHYTASSGDAPRCAAPSLSPSATRSISPTPLRSGSGPGGWASRPMIFSASQGKSAIQSPPSARRSTCEKHPRLGRLRRFKFTLPLFSSRGYSRGDRGSTGGIGQGKYPPAEPG